MLEFIQNNIGTIIVGAVILALVALVSWKLISDKKKGKSTCSCGCSSCPNSALCHSAKNTVKK